MKCPSCNATYKSKVKCCPKCGYLFDYNDVFKYSEEFNEELLDIYYPPCEYKEKKWNISIPYAIFTFLYAVYKRMYRCAILSFISLFIVFYYVPRFMDIVFMSGGFNFFFYFFIIVGAITGYIYYVLHFDEELIIQRKLKVNKIVKLNNGNNEKIKELVIEDSKGNVKGVIITILLMILALILYFVYKLFLT